MTQLNQMSVKPQQRATSHYPSTHEINKKVGLQVLKRYLTLYLQKARDPQSVNECSCLTNIWGEIYSTT